MNPFARWLPRGRAVRVTAVAFVFVAGAGPGRAQPANNPPPTAAQRAYLDFIKATAAGLRANERAPGNLAEWESWQIELRVALDEAWGGFPATDAPLQPRKLGELKRDGYRVEKIVFQTRPGVWMTANTYVPDNPGRVPAVLAVHGHWRGAKQDPVVQARNIGLVKHGFFVLAVDALGAGERGVGKALGEYHGDMTAATLFPLGLPLSGMQVYENMRAVDYLRSRPEVDPEKIGITGASGGGNQTMYAAAWDSRFAAAVPTCSVGNYQAYLGVACCMCEVVPGALRFTEEWGVLGLIAPRGLLVMNATRDSIQFSVAEARKSLALARPIFELHEKPGHLKHATFESPHDYNQPMRETMYGWMTRHLKGRGDGAPIAEGTIKVEDPEALRCFPGDTRPDDFVTLPKFAAAEARGLLASRRPPADARAWQVEAPRRLGALQKVLAGSGGRTPLNVRADAATLRFASEPGVTLSARHEPAGSNAKLAIVLDLEGEEKAGQSELAAELRRAGWTLVVPELRATGRSAWPGDKIGRAPDHTTAQWGLWIGRPLLGQWTLDVQRTLDAVASHGGGKLPGEVAVIGVGPAGLVALCAAAQDQRITSVATLGTLASYVTDVPYDNQRMGILAPGILRDVGDVAHLAALVAPRRVTIAGGVNGGGRALDEPALREEFRFARSVYEASGAGGALRIGADSTAAAVLRSLNTR